MGIEIYDPWSGEVGVFADTVFVEEGRMTAVLGPDGNPVRYNQRHKVEFDLRPKGEEASK